MKISTNLNLKELGELLVVGILLLIVFQIVTAFVVPVLAKIGLVAATGLGVTDTFLFLILLTLVVKK